MVPAVFEPSLRNLCIACVRARCPTWHVRVSAARHACVAEHCPNIYVRAATLQRMFNNADKDHSGSLGFQEFLKMMETNARPVADMSQ